MSLPEYYIGIDAETFGPNLNQNNATELGISIVHRATLKVIFKKSYPIRVEPWIMLPATELTECLTTKDNEGTEEVFNRTVFLLYHRTVLKSIDSDCKREFWKKHPERYNETIISVHNWGSYREHEVMYHVQKDIRDFVANDSAVFVTDTTAFDGGVFNSLFHPREDRPTDAKSLNVFFIGKNNRLAYKPVEQADAFARGIGWMVKAVPGDTVFTKACRALAVTDVPKWNVQHDHHPENDATVIALNHAFLVNRMEEIKKEIRSS